ncbi:MAG: ribbon-helix-helix protein, CopG family [Thermoplasmata archaeon]|nr:ribbon-helix-helix protein, CopG family [Thermoplasmata archaeon]
MASKKNVNEIISFSSTKELAEDIDKLTKDIGYSNRSELIRDSIRMLKKSKLDIDKMDGMVEGVIITLYDHSVETEVSKVRHGNMELIKSFMHTDFNERTKTCCDVLFISGQADNIKKLLFSLGVVKNVNEVKFFVA